MTMTMMARTTMVIISGCLGGTSNKGLLPPLQVSIVSFVLCHITATEIRQKNEMEQKKKKLLPPVILSGRRE